MNADESQIPPCWARLPLSLPVPDICSGFKCGHALSQSSAARWLPPDHSSPYQITLLVSTDYSIAKASREAGRG